MEKNQRIPGACIENPEDISWLDYDAFPIGASMMDNYPRNGAEAGAGSWWQAIPGHPSQSSKEQDVVVAVMGVTGAGKSTFVKTVSGRNDVIVGHNLSSETQEVRAYEFLHKDTSYILVDTPGFDDTNRKDSEITEQILSWIQTSLLEGTRLNGVIYLHRISDPRMGGTALRNNRMFRKLVGAEALKNVVLATTFWECVPPHVGAQREKELCSNPDFWGGMLERGAKIARLTKSRESGLALLERISADETVTLDHESVLREQREALERMRERMAWEKQAARLQREIEAEEARKEAALRLAQEREYFRMQREAQRVAEEQRLGKEQKEAEKMYERQLEEAWEEARRQEERRQRERAEMEWREREERARQRRRVLEAEAEVVRQRTEYQRNYVCIGIRPQWPCDKCNGMVQRYTSYYHCHFCHSDRYFHCGQCGNNCGQATHPYMEERKSDDCIVM